jgi:HK97 family phage major capsid protein
MNARVNPRSLRGPVAVRAEAPGMSQELKAKIEEIAKAFTDFKTENDERIKALSKGQEDVITTEKVDRINAAISELEKAQDEMAKKMARASMAGGDDARVQSARAFMARAQRKPVSEVSTVDVKAYENYVSAFNDWCRNNGNVDRLSTDVRAALSVGSDPSGGYLVPDEIDNSIERRLWETSPIRSVASVSTISTGAWESPYQASKAGHGGWVGERQARPETSTPNLGNQRIEVHEQFAYPSATQTMLEDAALDVEAWLNEEVSDEFTRQENSACVSGNGVMKPRGFASSHYTDSAVTTADATRAWGVLQYRASGSATGFPALSGIPGAADADALLDIIADMNPQYLVNARFAMNRRTQAHIRKLKDGDGRYLIDGGMGTEGKFVFSIHGFPIINFEDMDNIGSDAFALAFADFSGYKIVDRRGISVLRDPYTNKPHVGFYATKRVGGDIRNFDKIKLMKFATS